MKKRILSVIFAAFMLGISVVGLGACGGEQLSVSTPGNETQQGGNPQGDAPEVRTTVTEEEWRSALRMDGVRNVTMTIMVAINNVDYYKYSIQIDNLNWHMEGVNGTGNMMDGYMEILEIDNTDESTVNMDEYFFGNYLFNEYTQNQNGIWVKEQRQYPWSLISPIRMMGMFLGGIKIPFDKFIYNSTTNQYETENASFESINGAQVITDFESMIVKFENGRLSFFEAQYLDTNSSERAYCIKFTFSDYGTTKVTLPQVAEE